MDRDPVEFAKRMLEPIRAMEEVEQAEILESDPEVIGVLHRDGYDLFVRVL